MIRLTPERVVPAPPSLMGRLKFGWKDGSRKNAIRVVKDKGGGLISIMPDQLPVIHIGAVVKINRRGGC